MPMNYLQITLLVFLLLYIFLFVLPIYLVKHAGKDPKGILPMKDMKHSVIISFVFSIFTVIWIVIIIIYVINEQSVKWFWCITPLANYCFKIGGIIIMGIGLLVAALGVKDLGVNFRVAFPREKTKLVTSGIYRYTRNPIVLSIYLGVIGTFLIIPNMLMLITIICNFICYDTKVRAEEVYLSRVHKGKYERYKNEVGRYLLRIKRGDKI